MKRAKNKRQEKKGTPARPISKEKKEEWLKGREPDQMIDDHGFAILGLRERKPKTS